MLEFISKFITERLHNDLKLAESEFTQPKAFLFQMYFIISRLNEEKLVKLDYLVNFGVSLDVIHLILEHMENGGDYDDLKEVFVMIPFIQLLKVCRYLSWADKKLHSPLYIENKD
jgi:hypothetical protein